MSNLWDLKNPHLFYFPQILEENHFLDEEESKHCIRVMRLKEDDIIVLMDGMGSFFKASITSANPKRCAFHITDKIRPQAERNFYLHMAVAPTKNTDRFEWFLEKATEMGIDEITPVICQNSERRELKTVRLEKVLISAMKQSMHSRLPILNECMSLNDFFKKDFPDTVKYIAHCREGEKDLLKDIYKQENQILILIGPEGDFTAQEVEYAIKKQFLPISLGKSRLRTETAALAGCFAINQINS